MHELVRRDLPHGQIIWQRKPLRFPKRSSHADKLAHITHLITTGRHIACFHCHAIPGTHWHHTTWACNHHGAHHAP